MHNINISLNKTLLSLLKLTVPKKGYNNVSEYIRDLLRRDLRLEEYQNYPYDQALLKELGEEAKTDIKKGRVKKLKSIRDSQK